MKKFATILVTTISTLTLLSACGSSDEVVVDNSEKEKAPVLTDTNCFDGSTLFQIKEVPIQLCYEDTWKEPVVESYKKGKTGEAFVIKFPNAEGDSPQIFYKTEDFFMEDSSSEPIFLAFQKLNPEMDEGYLNREYQKMLNVSADLLHISKVAASNKKAVRVNNKSEGTLTYYVPSAFEGYHLLITGKSSIAVEIDDLAQQMIAF